jgi:pimeloyl-ACP methyl ester carboxylesterase
MGEVMKAKRQAGSGEPRLKEYLGLSLSGFHKLAYWEWGPENAARTAVCLHGLTRQGRDFDFLAARLVKDGYRVVCPDLVGRGMSGWLVDPRQYTLIQYGADMNALLARLDVDAVDWIGTSLGGLIGIMLAGQAQSPIRRLVVNDIGPYMPVKALRRIGAYLAAPPPSFTDLAEVETFLREILAPYGRLADEHWQHLARYSVRPDGHGKLRLAVDPRIAIAYRSWWLGSITMWPQWDDISCPTLLLRGAESDFLLASTAHEMTQRGPRAELLEFSGIGHVPALMTADQIEPIVDFLNHEDARAAEPEEAAA